MTKVGSNLIKNLITLVLLTAITNKDDYIITLALLTAITNKEDYTITLVLMTVVGNQQWQNNHIRLIKVQYYVIQWKSSNDQTSTGDRGCFHWESIGPSQIHLGKYLSKEVSCIASWDYEFVVTLIVWSGLSHHSSLAHTGPISWGFSLIWAKEIWMDWVQCCMCVVFHALRS